MIELTCAMTLLTMCLVCGATINKPADAAPAPGPNNVIEFLSPLKNSTLS